MKTISTIAFVLLATLAAPALAETATAASLTGGCQLAGPIKTASEDCKALRVAFQTEIGDCMKRLHADADARAGRPTANSSHTSRARFLTCDAATREKMAALFN